MGKVIQFACLIETVKTSDIEGEVECFVDVIKFGHIANVKISFEVLALEFVFCNTNGTRREINACHLPARLRKRNNVCARAATEVNGIACRVGLDELN